MIEEAGIRFQQLEPQSLDLPLGFKTGAGVIFGASGGVTEAVLRYAVEKLEGVTPGCGRFPEVRGDDGIREATLTAGGVELKLAVVHGLKNAIGRGREDQAAASADYDLIEVMACPGGCVGGAGQPVTRDAAAGRQRGKGLYSADKMMQLHKSQDNHIVAECYAKYLERPGSHDGPRAAAHRLSKPAADLGDPLVVLDNDQRPAKLEVSVCVGTSCFLRGSQTLLKLACATTWKSRAWTTRVGVDATFCFEKCDCGPTVHVGEETLHHCTLDMAREAIQRQLAEQRAVVATSVH